MRNKILLTLFVILLSSIVLAGNEITPRKSFDLRSTYNFYNALAINASGNVTASNFYYPNGTSCCGGGGSSPSSVDEAGLQLNISTLNVSKASHIGLEGNISLSNTLIGEVGSNLTSLNNSFAALVIPDEGGLQLNISTLNVSMATHVGLEGNISNVDTKIGEVASNLTSVNNSIVTLNGSVNILEALIGRVGSNVSTINFSLDTKFNVSGGIVTGDLNVTLNVTFYQYKSCNLETDSDGLIICENDDTAAGASVDEAGIQLNVTNLNLTYGSALGSHGINISTLNNSLGTKANVSGGNYTGDIQISEMHFGSLNTTHNCIFFGGGKICGTKS